MENHEWDREDTNIGCDIHESVDGDGGSVCEGCAKSARGLGPIL
jgi:hypothetical protein